MFDWSGALAWRRHVVKALGVMVRDATPSSPVGGFRRVVPVLGMLLAWSASAGAAGPGPGGGLAGTVPAAFRLQAVVAVEPYVLKVYQASIEAGSGRFRFEGLPPGEYDLLVKTEGRLHEGLNLAVDEESLSDDKQRQALRDEVRPFVMATEDYFDRKQIVRVGGTRGHARAFVVQTRTRQVVDPGGKRIDAHIRRFDLVDLVKTHKVWQIPTSRHLFRQEVPLNSKDLVLELVHCPSLGALLVGEQVRDLGVLDLAAPAAPPSGGAESGGPR